MLYILLVAQSLTHRMIVVTPTESRKASCRFGIVCIFTLKFSLSVKAFRQFITDG